MLLNDEVYLSVKQNCLADRSIKNFVSGLTINYPVVKQSLSSRQLLGFLATFP